MILKPDQIDASRIGLDVTVKLNGSFREYGAKLTGIIPPSPLAKDPRARRVRFVFRRGELVELLTDREVDHVSFDGRRATRRGT